MRNFEIMKGEREPKTLSAIKYQRALRSSCRLLKQNCFYAVISFNKR